LKYNYEWALKDAIFTKDKGKVFSCFACGGGSTMGYKLSGFDVIGMNEIDPKMAEVYIENHKPKHAFVEPIQEFVKRDDLPNELYNLDILDGSPPCSSFSLSGNREKDWGKEKKFREGQAEQVLDTLFFDFIELGKKLQPKVIIAENVKGLLQGDARRYVTKIMDAFYEAGYYVNYKLLDASTMGVPQRRQRVFFHAIRKDLYCGKFADLFQRRPQLNLEFKEKPILYKEVREKSGNPDAEGLSPMIEKYWELTKEGCSFSTAHPKGSYFNEIKLGRNKVIPTLRASGLPYDYEVKRVLYKREICKAGSFPTDYNFLNNKPIYLVGMSVPPIMTAQIADRVYDQWLKPLGDKNDQ